MLPAAPNSGAALNDEDAASSPGKSEPEFAALIGSLAHEIRNPLSTIKLNLALVVEDLGRGETPRERQVLQKLGRVQEECAHLEQILDGFLQFTRIGRLAPVLTDLNAEVRAFLAVFQAPARNARVVVSPHLAAHLPAVNLDRGLFRQVLVNLARNALEAMPAGGGLEFLTYSREQRVFLELIDTGQGMDQDTLARMFEMFYSTKPGGTGLGLATVRKIVDAHSGELACESEPGRGTRFILSFPADSEEHPHPESGQTRTA